MQRPLLLDLYSCAGGAAVGYYRAGFDVVGVDVNPQPRYPFRHVQADALAYLSEHWWQFDAIHASPPCQRYTLARKMRGDRAKEHPDLLPPTRAALQACGVPWVIENVPGSPMRPDVVLCGTMFGLGWAGLPIYRHRWFEAGGGFHPRATGPASCNHHGIPLSVFGHHACARIGERRLEGGAMRREAIQFNTKIAGGIALGIDWMNREELAEAIPPAYTEFLGRQLIAAVQCASAS